MRKDLSHDCTGKHILIVEGMYMNLAMTNIAMGEIFVTL